MRARRRLPFGAAFLTLVGPLVLGAAFLACGRRATGNDGPPAGSENAAEGGAPRTSLTPEQAAKVLAKVGDRTITLGEYEAALQQMDQFDRLRYQSPERRQELLRELINVELLAAEAKAKGYDQDPATQEAIRAVLRDAMLEKARAGARTPAEIEPEAVKAFYEAHRGEYQDPERRRLSVLVTKDEATANAALATATRGLSAAEWGDLVRAKSLDPQAHGSLPRDLVGDVGIVGPPGDPRGDAVGAGTSERPRLPDEVRAAGFAIEKAGEVYPHVVRAGGRVYLVRLSQILAPVSRTVAEAERSIRVRLAQEDLERRERELLDSLRREYPVQIDDEALARVRVASGDGGASP